MFSVLTCDLASEASSPPRTDLSPDANPHDETWTPHIAVGHQELLQDFQYETFAVMHHIVWDRAYYTTMRKWYWLFVNDGEWKVLISNATGFFFLNLCRFRTNQSMDLVRWSLRLRGPQETRERLIGDPWIYFEVYLMFN